MPEVPVQTNVPQPAPTESRFNWKKVLVVVLLGAALLGIVVGAYYYLYRFKSPSAGNNQIEIKHATPSAKPATPSAKQDETAGWKTYSNSKLGFSIKYPDNWFYNDATKYASDNCEPGPDIGDSTVIFARRDLKCVGIAHGGYGTGDFEVSIGDTEYKPLEQISTQIQKYEYIVIDGEKAAKTYRTPTSEGPWCSCTRIYFNHNGRGYQIEFVNKDLQGNYEPIYDKMLSTFKFLD